MTVYKITNLVNGKIYIGQTINEIEKRFRRHINDAINGKLDTKFARAIRKYGEDNFIIESIDKAKTQEELNQKEHDWIVFYNTVDNGYNETDSLLKCGGNTYRSKNEEEMAIIKEKISKAKIGEKNPNSSSVKIKNMITNEEIVFKTVKDCQDFFNEKTHRFITTRVTGRTKTLFKGVWNIAYSNCEYFDLQPKKTQNKCNIKVDKDGVIHRFTSIRSMCETLKIPRSCIRNGINRKVNGFKIYFE